MFTHLGRVSKETRNVRWHPMMNDGMVNWWFDFRY